MSSICSGGVSPTGKNSFSLYCVQNIHFWWSARVRTFKGIWWPGKAWYILSFWPMFVEKMWQVCILSFVNYLVCSSFFFSLTPIRRKILLLAWNMSLTTEGVRQPKLFLWFGSHFKFILKKEKVNAKRCGKLEMITICPVRTFWEKTKWRSTSLIYVIKISFFCLLFGCPKSLLSKWRSIMILELVNLPISAFFFCFADKVLFLFFFLSCVIPKNEVSSVQCLSSGQW